MYADDNVEETTQGAMDISFTIDKNGMVKDIKVKVKSDVVSGNPEAAAINAVKRLPRFIPATQNGKPVSFRITVPIGF